MQPLSPPPTDEAGAITQPRQLQRWLDINPVSQLTRTQAYITIPSFSIANTWMGYSTIVATYNFEGPNNFSLKALTGLLPTTPNYLLCVMWIDGSGNTHRYALWTGVGEVMPFAEVLYTGQLIKKNFRLEVWSTDNTPLVQVLPINLYTSVLGNVDYRYGSDFVLVGNDGEQTNFADILGAGNSNNLIPNGSVWGAYGAIISGHCVLEIDGFTVGAWYYATQGNAISIKPLVGGFATGLPQSFVASSVSYYILTTDSALAGVIITTTIIPSYPLPLTFPAGSTPQPNT